MQNLLDKNRILCYNIKAIVLRYEEPDANAGLRNR